MLKNMCLIDNNIVNKNDEWLASIDSFVEHIINLYIAYPEKILIAFIYISLILFSIFMLLIKKSSIL